MKRLKIIGVEEHGWLPEIRDALKSAFPKRAEYHLNETRFGIANEKGASRQE